jgi:hypothetical protein
LLLQLLLACAAAKGTPRAGGYGQRRCRRHARNWRPRLWPAGSTSPAASPSGETQQPLRPTTRHRPLGGTLASARGRPPPRSGSYRQAGLYHWRLHESAVQRDHKARLGLRPRARRWTGFVDLPGPWATHGMAAIEGRLYVVGGVGPASEQMWVYDPATDSWEAAPARLRR